MIPEEQAELFLKLEWKLMDPNVRSSPEKTGELLADQFVEFGRSGKVYDKQSLIQAIGEEAARGQLIVPEVRDFTVQPLSRAAVLLTYRTVVRGLRGGEELHTLRSSVWKLIGGRWQMMFHQGTPTFSGPL